MVTKERKFLSIIQAEKIIRESKGPEEAIAKLHNLPNRHSKSSPPPEGGISISKASQRYHIPHSTISGWVSHGFIPVLGKSTKEKYISEEWISKIAKKYDRRAPRGNRQILQILSDLTSN
jgi:hypothetical protein